MRSPLSWLVLACAGLAACAPKATTIPILSVGNTGCSRESLAVFNYQPEQRSWTAVCQGKLYHCSSVGGGGTRCAAAQDTTPSPELLQRAARLKALSLEQAALFVTEDIMAYDARVFDRLIAAVSLANPAHFEDVRSPHGFVILPDTVATKLAACTKEEELLLRIEDGRLHYAIPTGSNPKRAQCIQTLIERAPTSTRLRGDRALVSTSVTESTVAKWLEEHSLQMPEAAPPATTEATAAVQPAPAAPAASTSSALDAELRALLDARAEDLLACSQSPRILVEANVSAERKVSYAVRGLDPGDPVQGCVRAVLGASTISAEGPGSVVHLVRSNAGTSATGTTVAAPAN